MTTLIPPWNSRGVIPAISEDDPTGPIRSPYPVLLGDVVSRFSLSLRRVDILRGFLAFRGELHAVGLKEGFQWIDGSFLENTEELENRDPADLDVVTFYTLPRGGAQKDLFDRQPHLFRPSDTKERFCVDAYFVQLRGDHPELLVESATYWYSLWSHRRNSEWKGFLRLDLSPDNEGDALSALGEASV